MKRIVRFNSTHMIIYGFLAAVLLGTLILMLPICSASGRWTDFLTSLFTATTSICVTGLVVVPTYAYWSIVGKVVILILIQLGGLGIICMAMGLLMIMRKRISLRERRLIQESYNMDSSQGVIKHIRAIFIGTFIFEGIGMVLYMFSFVPRYGVVKGIGYSVFHSVSAFCNAGIDILGADSFIDFQGDILVNLTTIFLIVCGGIGFIVWWDILKIYRQIRSEGLPYRKIMERMALHTKLALSVTAILIVGGTLFTLILEYRNPGTIGTFSFGKKVLVSLFQSVTLRTAGFCTMSQVGIRNASFIIFCFFMLVGGSPMGTAGGIKTTTIAMIFLEVRAVITGKKNAEVFRRRIHEDNIKTALAVIVITLLVLSGAVIVLSVTENAPLRSVAFEAFSAIGTVGISMNLTASLTAAGKIIIIVLMFFGRVGPITIAMALAKRKRTQRQIKDFPEKRIIIG